MDSGAPDPALGVSAPLRLEPFRALMLSARRVGDPASARAFARPYRDVTERLRRWERQGHLRHDDSPALYLHEYTADGLTIRGLVGALDVSQHTADPDARVVLPHEAIEPQQSAELAGRMEQMSLNPAPILLVHRGPAEVRAVIHDVVCEEPWAEFTDRGERWNRVWAIRDPDRLRDRRRPPRRVPHAAGRRAPPLRRVPPAAAGAARHGRGPWPRDAGRPGRHPAVPRRDPPHPDRHLAGARSPTAVDGVATYAPDERGAGDGGAGAEHARADRRRRLGAPGAADPGGAGRGRGAAPGAAAPAGRRRRPTGGLPPHGRGDAGAPAARRAWPC